MPLQQDAIYLTPDGQRFKAKLDKRQYGDHLTWTLTQVDKADALWRDSQMLFLHRGRVVRSITRRRLR
jgi:hypothetical protein